MPVEITWFEEGAPEEFGALFHEGHGRPRLAIILRPHKSLTPEGFVWFIAMTAAMLAIPLLAVVSSPIFWGLLPFVGLVVWAMWAGLKRSWRDGMIYEELVIWPDHLRLTHKPPRKPALEWQTNPYWVRLSIRPEGGKVTDYLTLKAEGREVEFGAFLAPSERRDLYALLSRELRG